MTRLSKIHSHIASMDELLDIVGAMRSLAGMRVQESQHALPGIRSYADSMATAIGSALLLMPQPVTEAHQRRGRGAAILCMAEHGFVGGFNERMRSRTQSFRPSFCNGVLQPTSASGTVLRTALRMFRVLQRLGANARPHSSRPDPACGVHFLAI